MNPAAGPAEPDLNPTTPLVGAHLRMGGGLGMVVERARDIEAETVQIFPSSPRRWRPHRYAEDDLDALEGGLGSRMVPLFIHSIYLINLASPEEELRSQSARALAHALSFGARTGASAVVTHVGSHKGDGFETGLRRVVGAVEEAAGLAAAEAGDYPLPLLLLEGSAGAPNSLGRTVTELGTLVGSLSVPAGVCLDSAHLYAAGVPLHTPQGLEALLEEVDREVGLGRLGLFHLNDSRNPFGSGRDQHANLGHGEIGDEGLRTILTHPALQQVPFVMEVPGLEGHGPDRANMARARRLRAGD